MYTYTYVYVCVRPVVITTRQLKLMCVLTSICTLIRRYTINNNLLSRVIVPLRD